MNKSYFKGVHHVAIICSDYQKTKKFYTKILGLEIIAKNYRKERDSYKLDLQLLDGNQLEIFSFPDRPKRPSYPEAQGLRHLAFLVDSVEEVSRYLKSNMIEVEDIRLDKHTGKKFTFFNVPDNLPLELYEA